MAIMPGADWVGPHHDNGLMSRYDIVCIHTIVGNPPAHAAHFSTRADGWLFQSRDTTHQSAANLNGNHRIIAIENDDFGPEYGSWSGSNVPPFTAEQCESIALVCAWAHQVHGIPLELCPNSLSTSRGIAYHRQGIDGNFGGFAYGGRVSGGEVWTKHFGKVCPGDNRITQLINTIIPRARQMAGLEDDMAGEGAEIKAMLWSGGGVAGSVAPGTLVDDVERIKRMLWEGGSVPGSVAPGTLIDDVEKIKSKLDSLALGGVDAKQLASVLAPLLSPLVAKAVKDEVASDKTT